MSLPPAWMQSSAKRMEKTRTAKTDVSTNLPRLGPLHALQYGNQVAPQCLFDWLRHLPGKQRHKSSLSYQIEPPFPPFKRTQTASPIPVRSTRIACSLASFSHAATRIPSHSAPPQMLEIGLLTLITESYDPWASRTPSVQN